VDGGRAPPPAGPREGGAAGVRARPGPHAGPGRGVRDRPDLGYRDQGALAVDNDPTTAIRCIDRLAEILADFGTRKRPEARRTRDGRIAFVATHTTFDGAVKVAYDDVRHFGASIPLIAEHLLETLGDLLKLVPPSRHEPLLGQARAVLHSAREKISNPQDRAEVERMAERLIPQPGVDVVVRERAHGSAGGRG
jgi:hypothetical protein